MYSLYKLRAGRSVFFVFFGSIQLGRTGDTAAPQRSEPLPDKRNHGSVKFLLS